MLTASVLFVAALAWRLFYLARLRATPMWESLTADSSAYWDWAGFLMQSGPIGRNPFFLGPLYPYAIWPIRAVFGDTIQSLLVLQAIGGALAAVLLADAARRLTRPWVGIAIGVAVAFYEMAVFFDGLVLMESLLFLLEALLLWMIVRTPWPARRTVVYLCLGLLVGLLAQGRSTYALLLVPILLVLARGAGEQRTSRLLRGANLLLGFALIAAPVAIRNYAVSGEWIPFTYNLGYNLYVGNHPEATGGYVAVTRSHLIGSGTGGEDGGMEGDGRADLAAEQGLTLTAAGSSRYWTGRAIRFAREEPLRVAQLALQKIGMMWNAREYPQIENADQFRELAGPLGWRPIGTFAVVGPLAIAGLLFARRAGVPGRFLVWYACLLTAAIVPFFVTDRYRHHLVPSAVLLAALALETLLAWWRQRDARRGVLLFGLLTLGIVVTRLPAPALSAAGYEWGVHADLGTRWAERGRPDLAATAYESAIAIESRTGRRVPGLAGASERADLYYNYGNTLVRLGREAEALQWYARAVGEAPEHALAIQALALAHRRAGNAAQADSLETVVERKAGGAGLADVNRGWQAAQEGRWADAERLFRQATEASPRLSSAWTALIRLQVQNGEIARARQTYERAKAVALNATEEVVYEALLISMEGDASQAAALLADIPEEALRWDPVLAEIAGIVKTRSTRR